MFLLVTISFQVCSCLSASAVAFRVTKKLHIITLKYNLQTAFLAKLALLLSTYLHTFSLKSLLGFPSMTSTTFFIQAFVQLYIQSTAFVHAWRRYFCLFYLSQWKHNMLIDFFILYVQCDKDSTTQCRPCANEVVTKETKIMSNGQQTQRKTLCIEH